MAGGISGLSFGNSSSGGSSSTGISALSFGKSGSLSPQQVASLQAAVNQNKGTSLLGDIKGAGGSLLHGTGSFLGKSLELLGRPVSAIDTALTEGALAGDQWNTKTFSAMGSGFWAGLSGKKHDTFSDYIRAEYPKFAAHHHTLTALAGFAGTLATDPTLPLIIGAQALPGANVAVDQAEAARLASIMGTGADAATNLEHAKVALDAMDAATRSSTDTMFSWRKALASLEQERATAQLTGTAARPGLEAEHAIASAGATVEEKQFLRNALQLKYAVPFSGGKTIPLSPVMLGGKRVAPLLPTLSGVAKSSIPFANTLAQKTGEAFVHGFGTESYAKPALAATTKATELAHAETSARAFSLLGHNIQTLTKDEKYAALNFGETRHGIVSTGGGGRTLNLRMLDRAVTHGELSQNQADYIKNWHTMMEHMRTVEHGIGIKYEHVGDKLYVPHNLIREGGFARKNEIAGAYGFARERQHELTLQQVKDAVVNHPDRLQLIHNPDEILSKRIEQHAHAVGKQTLRNVLAKAIGVPDKIPDMLARRKALTTVRGLMKKQRDLATLSGLHGMRTSLGKRFAQKANANLNDIMGQQHKLVDAIDRRIAFHNEQLHNPAEFTPTFSQARGLSRKAFHDRISHFQGPDKIRAGMIHGEIKEVDRLKSKLSKIPVKRGGSQADVQKLGNEVNVLLKRINKRRGHDFTPVDMKPNRGARETWRGNVAEQLNHAHRMVKGDFEEVRNGYKIGQNTDHNKAIGNLEQRREQIMRATAAKINAANEKLKGQKGMAREALDNKFQRESTQYKNLDKQVAREQKKYGKMKKNDAIPEGFRMWETKIQGMRYHFPDEVHAAMTNLERVTNNPGVEKQLADTLRKYMGVWKIGVTSVNPGYRVRNTASDVWNMYIAGVPMPRILQYGHKAVSLQTTAIKAAHKVAAGVELTPTEFKALHLMNEMQLQGVLSGLFQGDIQQVANMFHNGQRARDYLKTPGGMNLGRAYIKWTSDMNRHAENAGRMTHYLYRRQYQHMSPRAAAEWVKKAHFDYEELTPFERNKMKLIFPFYTWTRKDLPYQLSQMVNRPGKYQVFADVVNTSNELAGGQPDQQPGLMPKWMRESYMFKVPGFGDNAMMNPMIGVTDLQAIEHPLDWTKSNMNPVFKGIDAALTGNNPDTGQPIVGSHPRNPVTAFGGALLSAIPGSNVGPTERMSRGKMVQGEGMNPWFSYLASQTPLTNLLINGLSNIKTTQRGGTTQALVGYGLGASVYNRDLIGEQTAAQLNFKDHMKQVLRGLRDNGQLPESKPAKPSSYQLQLNQLLKGG